MQTVTGEDLAELASLLAQAKRPAVIEVLKRQQDAWTKQLEEQKPSPAATPLPAPIATTTVSSPAVISYTEPSFYWDENNNAVKYGYNFKKMLCLGTNVHCSITFTIPGVHELPAENIKSTFDAKEATITVHGKQNYRRTFRDLHAPILPDESSHSVKKVRSIGFMI